jgi:predicted peptidase
MNTKFRLLAIALVVAILSVQCTTNNDNTPSTPSTIDQFFEAGTFSHEGESLKYQECHLQPTLAGKAPLVVVLHGQYANGSDNKAQLHQDAMIKVWNYLYSSNIKAVMLAPQCPTGCNWDENPKTTSRLTMVELLKAMLDDYIKKQSNIDTSRIYILGYSDANRPAGAGGVWRMLSEYPDMFASAMVVAADPDDDISSENVAKTPVLSVRGETDTYAIALTLDSFADAVRDLGGVIREDIIQSRSRGDVCREAFNAERLDWVMQYTK